MAHKKFAININFDSIRECLKLAGGDPRSIQQDPAFFGVMDRFISIADEYHAKLTVFVIGKDLEDRKNFEQVRSWRRAGHEIGNHTYSHHQYFGQMDRESINTEIKKAHEIITECIGRPPIGFVAPAWNFSPHQTAILHKLGYQYDTSFFPSYLMPAIQLILRFKSGVPNRDIPLIRKDFIGSLIGSHQPYMANSANKWGRKKGRISADSILMLPLPTTALRIPMWHTLALHLPREIYLWMLVHAIERCDAFYYLMHPADLVCSRTDLKGLSVLSRVDRMCQSLEKKEALVRSALDRMAKCGQFVTMERLAQSVDFQQDL